MWKPHVNWSCAKRMVRSFMAFMLQRRGLKVNRNNSLGSSVRYCLFMYGCQTCRPVSLARSLAGNIQEQEQAPLIQEQQREGRGQSRGHTAHSTQRWVQGSSEVQLSLVLATRTPNRIVWIFSYFHIFLSGSDRIGIGLMWPDGSDCETTRQLRDV